MTSNNKINTFESGIKSLSLIGRLHQKSIDPEELIHDYKAEVESRPELATIQLLRAAKACGFKAKRYNSPLKTLEKAVFPLLAKHSNGHYFIVVDIKDDKALVHDSHNKDQQYTVDISEVDKISECEYILLVPRKRLLSQNEEFGFKWFIPALKRYKSYFSDVVAASFFIQLLALASPIFFQVAIDKVMVHKGMTTLDVLAVGFLAVIIFEVVLGGLRTYLFSHTTNRIDVELGSKLYQHMLALPISYFKSRRVGDTVARLKELDSVREFMTGSSLTVVLDLFFTLVFFSVMFYYAPLLAWIVVGSLPFYCLIALLLGPKLRTTLEKKFQYSAENHAFLVESVNGVETIKSSAVEPQMRSQWNDKLANYVSVSFSATNLNNIYGQLANFITKVTGLLILYFGAIAVTDGDLTIGQFIAFNILAQRVSAPIMRFANLWQDFQQARISVARLGDILNTPTEQSSGNKISLPKLNGEICFDHVSFGYTPERPKVLENLCFKVKQGEVIGIVGRSGSGKSSLTKLIQRLYLPQAGRVLVDGVDTTLINPDWLRQNVGVVLQENFLFNASVRENIALSDPAAPIERIIEVAKLAGAHDFILEMPHAYDTQIGEQGGLLSGGQRQRIAIARALLSDPSVLIFDEATSALDYESEQIIQRNMAKICAGRTVFIIAHRLSAVRGASNILVLDKGRLIEQGDHHSLLDKNGHYAYLCRLQGSAPSKKVPIKRQSKPNEEL
ncbi:type I secretion system permease/ATPase [Pseudoalteromonas luteoviolacea]|uniref:Peptidase C39 n=1 Tax=Pseudoalteromonas luteoviolacea S4054 TaxID=1129367 RepID=A0A0F6A4R2_9GAMM|nr:type I secretion system permease/ATPase [Pseudoalteromonas luteoviolacea]AOT08177.1 peptidase C39 [Pseudoalteromonas luteoviolacea]AOT13094.1 peptidase C39 [Pseudoalteromonas luteoviolacea]AOT18006.1 peptidase C39 [Pseudoalteromonas luteoviolacea]KKE81162.1 hypothetical protein N479_23635 [Pseudoalteromonas luteoviolacea S4054]KZN65801.1 hypothetical protein N481_24980 [Pseudoalteromonas luteoviolacea S4047-1]